MSSDFVFLFSAWNGTLSLLTLKIFFPLMVYFQLKTEYSITSMISRIFLFSSLVIKR